MWDADQCHQLIHAEKGLKLIKKSVKYYLNGCPEKVRINVKNVYLTIKKLTIYNFYLCLTQICIFIQST
jgi:hypothetical protein